ncbi:MAG: type IV secretion protein DotG [Micavibrio aeruginosavorus]|uniref:Type IV secretion protein DotG n=1 Tax=Micavibrio aeruginosavorus TaxID=349221 RepID=A0A2W5A2N3_9BACT|nr:MAG: type IV secretion protein DotG [Micavibrio aeruginosavorus]
MSNNDDLDNDLDVDNFDDTGFDDFSKKGTLGDVWRNNPMVKIGVILAAFAVIVGGVILFGGSDDQLPVSQLSGPQDVNEAPGSSQISETMRQSIEDVNIDNVEDATRTGGSAMPIPTDTSKGVLPIPMEENGDEDPLERWRRMQEERVRQQEMLAQTQEPAQPQAPPVDTKTPAVNALSQSMVSQMQAVLQNQQIPKPNYKRITPNNFLEELENKKFQQYQQQQQQLAAMGGMQTNSDLQVENILIPAGTIEYAQLMIEANTDAPGPVMAQIVSGPLRGGRVIGSFQSTEEYLVLSFNMVVIDGINYPVQAVAVDPGTTMPGLITEIDRRYFRRVVLPAAAAFVEGLTEAVSESGSTTIFIDGNTVSQSTSDKDNRQEVASGIAEAGQELSDILDEEADRTRPMLRVASGTPLGILFVSPVSDVSSR